MSRLRWPDSTNSVSEKPGTIHSLAGGHAVHWPQDPRGLRPRNIVNEQELLAAELIGELRIRETRIQSPTISVRFRWN